MIKDIENKKINLIIVKDLSRFGRLSSKISYYLEEFFIEKGVRFIAVTDDIDTGHIETSEEMVQFKAFFNEWFLRDTSRKVRNGKKTRAKEARNAMSNATTSDNEFLNSLDDFIDQSFRYGVRIEGDKLMFYGQDGKVYNLQTRYSTDELEVRNGYVYFKEPIQDNSGNTVEILKGGSQWLLGKTETDGELYAINVNSNESDDIFVRYDKEGKYIDTYIDHVQ